MSISAHGRPNSLTMTCGGVETTLEPRAPSRDEQGDDLPAYEWKKIGDAAVLRIRRLSGDQRDEEKLLEIAGDYPKHASSKLVVFDLRGNSGGSDGYVGAWIDQGYSGRVCSSTVEFVPPWALARCIVWNWTVLDQAAEGILDKPEARAAREHGWASMDEHRRNIPLGLRLGCQEVSAKKPYRGRVVVLVDRNSGSSGESSAFMLADTFGAPIVGERTYGAVEYGNVRPYLLPRTGAVVHFGGKRSISSEPREGVGLPVDAYLDNVDAPIDELLPVLEAWLARRSKD